MTACGRRGASLMATSSSQGKGTWIGSQDAASGPGQCQSPSAGPAPSLPAALLPLCSPSVLPAEFPNVQIKPSSAFHSVDLRLIAFSILYIFNAVPVAVHVTRSNKLFRYCCIHFLPVHALRQTQSRY